MEQIGWSLVDTSGKEIQFWGDTPGVMLSVPDVISLPNGDQVHCASPGPVQEWRLVRRMFQFGSPSVEFDGSQVVIARPAPVQI